MNIYINKSISLAKKKKKKTNIFKKKNHMHFFIERIKNTEIQ